MSGSIGARPEDRRLMRRALRLAERGAGETNPNPMVGCVIAREGRVIAEGFHARAGGPHAEVLALERAGGRARGATLYVGLEPCAHHGRTPPCAPRVVASGVARVVAALRDPNPLVSGRGFALLRRAGIEVTSGVLAAEARLQNERFLTAAAARRPFVLLKAAVTLDGRLATASGDSRWITTPRQRRAARRLRRLHDGVLVGIGTVLADDPLLLPEPRTRRPFHRVVLDSRLRLPLESRLVASAARGPVLVLTRAGRSRRRLELSARGVRVISAPRGRGRVGLGWALAQLHRLGLSSLMVEGGAEVLGSFLDRRLFDQVALFRAPLLLGGRTSRPCFGGRGARSVAGAVRVLPALRRLPAGGAFPPTHPAGPGFGEHCEVWYPVE